MTCLFFKRTGLNFYRKNDTLTGSYTIPIDVDTYVTIGPIIPYNSNPIPLVISKGERIEVFIDTSHTAFKTYRIRPEHMVAAEVAMYVYDLNRSLTGQQYAGVHTLSNIEWNILRTAWADRLEDSHDRIKDDIRVFFAQLGERLPEMLKEYASDIFVELDEGQQKRLVDNMLSQGEDIGKIPELKASGGYLRYIDEDTVIDIFRKNPVPFFDGQFWSTPYDSISELSGTVIAQAQQRVKAVYFNCLEDVAGFLKYKDPQPIITQRARLSLEFLRQRLV